MKSFAILNVNLWLLLTIILISASNSYGCQGGDTCCTPDNKCGEDEGDCDSDNDCQEGLKCGVDNCSNKGNGNPKPFPNNEWDATDDCCYKPAKGENECQDMGLNKKKFWVDKMGFSCELYEGADWCTPSKGYGDGWNDFWGRFGGFKRKGKSATKACCACGGGIRNPKKFSNKLPVYTGIKDYPYGDVDYRFTANDEANKNCYNCKEGMIWHDSWGYSCKAYYYGNFCTKDGKTGKGWKTNQYGSIKSYKNGGKNAFQACGACKKD